MLRTLEEGAVRTYETAEEVFQRAAELVGVPLRFVDRNGRLAGNKGGIGEIIEESWFGLTVNNRSEPDIANLGIELKATPFRRGRKISAKERLVCNIIDFNAESENTFETSSFMRKCGHMLFLFYEHKKRVDKGNFFVEKIVFFKFPEADLEQMRLDYEVIVSKIRAGRAHEISERDTQILGACTKGSTAAKSFRSQPYSDVLAKQRAFCLKQPYMTRLLRTVIFAEAPAQ